MDEVLRDLVLGVLANGLTSALRGTASLLVPRREPKASLALAGKLAPELRVAIDHVVETMSTPGTIPLEPACLFLSTPEAESLVRHMFYTCARRGAEPSKTIDQTRAQFVSSFRAYVGIDSREAVDFANRLFNTLFRACEANIANSALRTHGMNELAARLRHRLVFDELASMRNAVEALRTGKTAPLKDILAYEQSFRGLVGLRHALIAPPHFDTAKRVPIDEIYVTPTLIPLDSRAARGRPNSDGIPAERMRSMIGRTVLLGNPGGGKSTFAAKLCADLAHDYEKRLVAGRLLTPVLVVLREYGAARKESGVSITQFIENQSNSSYQLPAPMGAIDYLLHSGRVIVVFDGLDELLDTSYRQQITDAIESFAAMYRASPILVTSRRVGYEQAPLDGRVFSTFELDQFTPDQTREYARKWFALDDEMPTEQRAQRASSFMSECVTAPDLISNPLMLGLMCSIYRGENYIPKNRAELYEKCSLMLFERWDKRRNIIVQMPFEDHIRPAIMYLAHWIYGDEALQGGVTEARLVAKAQEYLCPRRFEDPAVAEKAAASFIETCRGRAWVFTDTGTTADGDRLYQFTHRTFLEYFTAAHLARTNATAADLDEALSGRIGKREWDVAAQLAYQIKNKNVEGAGDALLTMLLQRARGDVGLSGLNYCSFAARALQSLVPSPKVAREISNACLERFFQIGERIANSGETGRKSGPTRGVELVGDLLRCVDENRPPVEATVLGVLSDRASAGSGTASVLACELGLQLGHALHRGGATESLLSYWRGVSERFTNENAAAISSVGRQNAALAVTLVSQGRMDVAALVSAHGPTAAYVPTTYIGFPDRRRAPLALMLANGSVTAEPSFDAARRENAKRQLAALGRCMIAINPPWMLGAQDDMTGDRWISWVFDEQRTQDPRALEADAALRLGAFVALAPFFETNDEEMIAWMSRVGAESPSAWIAPIAPLFRARCDVVDDATGSQIVKDARLPPEATDAVLMWMLRRQDFRSEVARSSEPPTEET